MDNRPTSGRGASTGISIAAVAGLLVCCAAKLLVVAGLLTSAGVLLDNLVVIAVGAGVLGWAASRAVRAHRARQHPSTEREPAP